MQQLTPFGSRQALYEDILPMEKKKEKKKCKGVCPHHVWNLLSGLEAQDCLARVSKLYILFPDDFSRFLPEND